MRVPPQHTPAHVSAYWGEVEARWHDALDAFFLELDTISRKRRFNHDQAEALLADYVGSEVADEWRDWVHANQVEADGA